MESDTLRTLPERHVRPDETTAVEGTHIAGIEQPDPPSPSMSCTVRAVPAQGPSGSWWATGCSNTGRAATSWRHRPAVHRRGGRVGAAPDPAASGGGPAPDRHADALTPP